MLQRIGHQGSGRAPVVLFLPRDSCCWYQAELAEIGVVLRQQQPRTTIAAEETTICHPFHIMCVPNAFRAPMRRKAPLCWARRHELTLPYIMRRLCEKLRGFTPPPRIGDNALLKHGVGSFSSKRVTAIMLSVELLRYV